MCLTSHYLGSNLKHDMELSNGSKLVQNENSLSGSNNVIIGKNGTVDKNRLGYNETIDINRISNNETIDGNGISYNEKIDKNRIGKNETIDINKITDQNLINQNKMIKKQNAIINMQMKAINKQNAVVKDLRGEIGEINNKLERLEENCREEISKSVSSFVENSQYNAAFTRKVNKDHDFSSIQMENLIMEILTEIFDVPSDFKTSRKDMSKWLRSELITKDFETKMFALIMHLKGEVLEMVDNTRESVMYEILSKIDLAKEGGEEKLGIKERQQEVSDEHIVALVNKILAVFDSDKTGLVDYALESSGGSILSTRCTESYQYGTVEVSIFGIPLLNLGTFCSNLGIFCSTLGISSSNLGISSSSNLGIPFSGNSPRSIITPGTYPGNCWAFKNFPGFVVIKLMKPVKIDAFSYEHVSKKLVPHEKINSAPKKFQVYGLESEHDLNPILIGEYVYNIGNSLQFFIASTEQIFEIIELRVISNHGNPDFTCIYRFRVHASL